MPHYYFDIETTGLDSTKDQIITIQFQRIVLEDSRPEGPITILKSWEEGSSETEILHKIFPLIAASNPWKFVPVGNNLNFEFKFLLSKIGKYLDKEIDPLYFHSRPHIDLKHVMIILNGGRFKGYNLFLKKIENGSNVPIWYKNKDYNKIINYVEMEAQAFTDFYTNVHRMIFNRQSREMILGGELKNK